MSVTIWIANDAGHPGYPKARLIAGDDAVLRPLTVGNVNTLQVDRLFWTLAQGITKYVQPEDYLLFSGTAMIPAAALLLWINMHGHCHVLQWHALRQEYRKHTITAEGVQDLLAREMARRVV